MVESDTAENETSSSPGGNHPRRRLWLLCIVTVVLALLSIITYRNTIRTVKKQDQLEFNEVEVTEKAFLSASDKEGVEKQISSRIEELSTGGLRDPGYKSVSSYLINMVPHSIPILLKKLDHPNTQMRIAVLSVLRDIAYKQNLTDKRTCAFWKDLISGYNRESDVAVKKEYLRTLGYCRGFPPEDHNTIVQMLREEMTRNEDESLRLAAALGLIDLDIVQAMDSLIDEDLLDGGVLDEKSIPFLLQHIRISEGEMIGSVSKLKQWWEENKDRLEAEEAAAVGRDNEDKK